MAAKFFNAWCPYTINPVGENSEQAFPSRGAGTVGDRHDDVRPAACLHARGLKDRYANSLVAYSRCNCRFLGQLQSVPLAGGGLEADRRASKVDSCRAALTGLNGCATMEDNGQLPGRPRWPFIQSATYKIAAGWEILQRPKSRSGTDRVPP